MIGQADAHDRNLAYFTKTRAGKQKKNKQTNKKVLSHHWLSHRKSNPHGEVQGRA